MLGEKVKDSDVFDILHSEDCRILVNAKAILREAPIHGFLSGDNVDRVWFDKNIRAQEELLQLKTRIDSVANQYQINYYQLEGECLSSGEYEFIKVRDERIATIMANEPEMRDKKISIQKLQSISSYTDGLLWSLRDLMKLFKR